jgi:glutamate/tyrosine decarboxylase-like PLP-dependent enzyme
MRGMDAPRSIGLDELLPAARELIRGWEAGFGPFQHHPAAAVDAGRLAAAFERFGERMAGNHPFFHPRYAGQMLKPPHPVAVAGHLAAMLVNPNNHALDGGPVTSGLEIEAVAALAGMLGLPGGALGHLTGGGTVANLEALWVARELHPGRAVVYGAGAHYTHERMCGVLGLPGRRVAADAEGRIDLDAVERECARGGVGTVVLTAGTTGLGAVDRIDEALALRERHGVRLHVDAAYGGFFALLAGGPDPLVPAAPFAAIGACDSVVVDPHKHGLQPYGCGAVLFRDPAVARLYRHDSPYTYFTPGDLHLGEISLECSRAGAAAAGLWLTLQALPLAREEGLGPILAAGVRAARRWAELIGACEELELHVAPELDILTFLPAGAATPEEVDRASAEILALGMADVADPVYLSLLAVERDALLARHPRLAAGASAGAGGVRILRSVLMKPEHELAVPWLHERVRALARDG